MCDAGADQSVVSRCWRITSKTIRSPRSIFHFKPQFTTEYLANYFSGSFHFSLKKTVFFFFHKAKSKPSTFVQKEESCLMWLRHGESRWIFDLSRSLTYEGESLHWKRIAPQRSAAFFAVSFFLWSKCINVLRRFSTVCIALYWYTSEQDKRFGSESDRFIPLSKNVFFSSLRWCAFSINWVTLWFYTQRRRRRRVFLLFDEHDSETYRPVVMAIYLCLGSK